LSFKNSFKQFKEFYNSEGFKFLARPGQTLREHMENMVKEGTNYILNCIRFNSKYSNMIKIAFLITSLTHDFGKLNKYFQYKIYSLNNDQMFPLPKDKRILSYHTLISACFCEIFSEKIANSFLFTEKEKKKLKIITITTTLCHHSPSPSLDFTNYFNKYGEEELKELFNFLNENVFIKKHIEDICKLYHKYLDILKILIHEKENHLVEINPSEVYEKLISTFSINKLEDIKYYFDDIEDILDLETLVDIPIQEKFDIYSILLYISSLMCDLDIWDARFFEPKEKTHKIDFYDNIPCLQKDIVENYVSKPFGMISNNFESYIPTESDNTISILRTSLFEAINQEMIKPFQIYLLNSPTGAGKTLNLLNFAHKTSEIIYNNFGVKPKIIYSLPFISIGDQVATQILKLYDLDDKSLFLNSNLLTIDNYLTENTWSFNEHNNEIKMYDNYDVKWLISSWRSQYLVTTFVKFFNSILKPIKQNFLRFHRLANSIIILDEIQCLPPMYWELTRRIAISLSKIFNCTIVLSTATQPALMEKNEIIRLADNHLNELVEINGKKISINNALNRYILRFFPDVINFCEFKIRVVNFCLKNHEKNIMIVLNTKRSVYDLSSHLKIALKDQKESKIHTLSTLILANDRVDKINELKEFLEKTKKSNTKQKNRIILITTQLIEAGVDISFNCVFRDIAPLDSVIQVAGRCNRNNEYLNGEIFLLKLRDDASIHPNLFFNYVYKAASIVLDITEKILKSGAVCENNECFGECFIQDEKSLRGLFSQYFAKIKTRRITGTGVKEVNNLDFESLTSIFQLISDYENQVPLFIIKNDDANKIFKNILKKGRINSKFHQYTININHKDAEKLEEEKNIKKIILNNETCFYILPFNNVERFYDPNIGFKLYN